MGKRDLIDNQSCAICGYRIGDRTFHTFKKVRDCLFASNKSLVVALRQNDELLLKIKELEGKNEVVQPTS